MANVAQAIEEFVANSLGVNLIEMVIQISSTIVLFLVVKFFFWNHVTDFLEKRKAAMNEEFVKAKTANEEASKAKLQADAELHEIRQSAKGIYDEAKERGEQERKNIVSRAKQEADRLLENAQAEIENELEKARTDINNEIVSVATLMAEKIIEKELDPNKQKDIIERVTKEVSN